MQVIAVDDEKLALENLLQAIGEAAPEAKVNGFVSPEQALEYARESHIDVAFLDIQMGSLNGLEVARALKTLHRSVNIVFVTAYSKYALEAFDLYVSGYLLKPVSTEAVQRALGHLRHPVAEPLAQGLVVQTFGNFEVFVDGQPLRFARSKAKELFAYLIHKRGSSCTTREVAAVLFEDQPYTLSVQRQVQTIFSSMMRTLRAAEVSDCIIKTYNRTAVDVSKVDCDYYRFLNGDIQAVNAYAGEYMTNYGWAEFVVGYLASRRS